MTSPDEDSLAEQGLRRDQLDVRIPGVVRCGEPVVSAEEACAALGEVCRAVAAGQGKIKLFVDGTLITETDHSLLPHAGEDAAAYLDRVAPAPDFAIYCGGIQVHSPLLFDRVRAFLARLFGPDWVPSGWVDAELFVGRYAYTPGGIHNEERFNLHCVLDGEKQMLVWPENQWASAEPPDLSGGRLPAALHSPNVLSGAVGDMMHWPPRYWHVGRSPRVSIGLNIAVYPVEPFDVVLQALAGEMRRRFINGGSGERPAAVDLSSWAIRRQTDLLLDCAASPDLARAAAIELSRRRSSSGFRLVPPRRQPVHLSATRPLHRPIGARVCWETTGSYLTYFGNGHAARARVPGGAARLLAVISEGNQFTLTELSRLGRPELTADNLRALTEDLYCMRVIDHV